MRTVDVGRFGIERTPIVLFDFDGTLADTGAAVMRVARAVLRDVGIEAAEADSAQDDRSAACGGG